MVKKHQETWSLCTVYDHPTTIIRIPYNQDVNSWWNAYKNGLMTIPQSVYWISYIMQSNSGLWHNLWGCGCLYPMFRHTQLKSTRIFLIPVPFWVAQGGISVTTVGSMICFPLKSVPTDTLLCLVGGWATPLKNMKVNWDDDIPNIWENNPNVPNHQPAMYIANTKHLVYIYTEKRKPLKNCWV